MRLSDLDAATQERVREQLGLEKPQPVIRPEDRPGAWNGKEKDFLFFVEKWLTAQGYLKRTKNNILFSAAPVRGWQVHVARTIGNPYLLDILLLGNDGRYMEFELKTDTGKLSDIQEALCAAEIRPVYRGMDEVKQCVKTWEKQQ